MNEDEKLNSDIEPLKLSDNIKEWCLELDSSKLVYFEEYGKTISRGNFEEDEDNEDNEEESEFPIKLKDFPNLYSSPVGPVMIPELIDASKYFKLWTIYTKVPLTTRLLLKIEDIAGIETLESLARYRARIGVAPLFKDGEVMMKVKKIIEDSVISELKL